VPSELAPIESTRESRLSALSKEQESAGKEGRGYEAEGEGRGYEAEGLG
jgi:hypothetical protein